MVADPTALAGADAPDRPRRGHATLTRDPESGVWSGAFVMGAYNRQVVLRTDALLGGAYGPAFDYREVMDAGTGPLGVLGACALTAAQAGLIGALSTSPTRALADRVLPAPGEGPSEKVRRKGRFRVEVVTTTTTGARYRATVAAPYDPGYGGTAVLLGESALALVYDDLPEGAGVLTPMTGIGPGLADRLRAHGVEVSVGRA